jgi:hypothetical protein
VGLLLVAPVVFVGFCFAAVAYLTKRGSRLFEEQILPSSELIEFAPTIGWKPRANLNAHYLTLVKDGVFHTITDAKGWPDRSNITDSNVVVFGDSYAFGYGVNSRATFWNQAKEFSIKALGAPGYNMAQEMILMGQHAAELKDKLVIWFIYFGNDLYDNLVPNNQYYRSPFVRKPSHASNWQLTTEHVSLLRWPNRSDPQYYDRLAEICSATSMLSERAFSACEFLIAEGQKICLQAQAKLVLMTIPDAVQLTPQGREKLANSAPDRSSFDADLPDKQIKKIAAKLEIPVIALMDHLSIEDYKERDPHWNERGHRRVANVIGQVWRNNALRPGLAPTNEPWAATGLVASKVSSSL